MFPRWETSDPAKLASAACHLAIWCLRDLAFDRECEASWPDECRSCLLCRVSAWNKAHAVKDVRKGTLDVFLLETSYSTNIFLKSEGCRDGNGYINKIVVTAPLPHNHHYIGTCNSARDISANRTLQLLKADGYVGVMLSLFIIIYFQYSWWLSSLHSLFTFYYLFVSFFESLFTGIDYWTGLLDCIIQLLLQYFSIS